MIERFYKGLGSVLKSKKSTVIKELNEEQRKCIEIVYAPMAKDAHGEWASASTIKEAEASYQRNEVVPNLFHVVSTDRFELTKSWILEEDTTYSDTGIEVTKGTWMIETHFIDDDLWSLKKIGMDPDLSMKEKIDRGGLGGVSLGGYGRVNTETGEITNLLFSKEEFIATQGIE